MTYFTPTVLRHNTFKIGCDSIYDIFWGHGFLVQLTTQLMGFQEVAV